MMAPVKMALAEQESSSPSQLDQAQVLKASTALLRHIQSEATKGAKKDAKNLFAVDEAEAAVADNAEAIWCQITTKKHIVDEKRLKPTTIPLPHSLHLAATTSILLITPDPQRIFKDALAHPSFPPSLAAQIRVLGLTKLKQRYKTFESRRQLKAQHDVVFADDRIITMLPRLLGKIFYESSRRPVPVHLEAPRATDAAGKPLRPSPSAPKSVARPATLAAELERTLTSARVHLSPSVSTAVHVGWSSFPPEHLTANIDALVAGMADTALIPHGWRNLRAVHIKGAQTAALPVWMAQELWVDAADVLEDAEAAEQARLRELPKGKRKGRALDAETEDGGFAGRVLQAAADEGSEVDEDDEIEGSRKRIKREAEKEKRLVADDEMAARREALRAAKRAGREAAAGREAVAVTKRATRTEGGTPKASTVRTVSAPV